MLRRIISFLAAISVAISLSASLGPGDPDTVLVFDVEKYEIKDFSLVSLRKVRGEIQVVINYPGENVSLTGIDATIYRKGEEFGTGHCPGINMKKGRWKYTMSGVGTLSSNYNFITALYAIIFFDPKDFSISYTMDVQYENGEGFKHIRNNVPITEYVTLDKAAK